MESYNSKNLLKNSNHGYYELLEPLDHTKLNDFFTNDYYANLLVDNIQNESDILLNQNRSREWLENTYYEDALKILKKYSSAETYNLIDIGCGTGEFMSYMQMNDYSVFGVEPSLIGNRECKSKGLNVVQSMFEDLDINLSIERYSVINLTNVLSYTSDIYPFISKIDKILHKDGIIRIQECNDFNPMQIRAAEVCHLEEFWVDKHKKYYFNIDSLSSLMGEYNYEIVYSTVDFPMSLFLVMGYNYRIDKIMGKKLHNKRIEFEMALSRENREAIYQYFKKENYGRNMIIYCKKR